MNESLKLLYRIILDGGGVVSQQCMGSWYIITVEPARHLNTHQIRERYGKRYGPFVVALTPAGKDDE